MRMQQRLTLQQKMLLIIIGISATIFILSIGYIGLHSRGLAVSNATLHMSITAEMHASKIHWLLEEDLVAMRTLASTVVTLRTQPFDKRQAAIREFYQEIIQKNPQYLAIWDSWEMSKVDSGYSLPHGRFVNEFWRVGQKIETKFSKKSLLGDPEDYARIKKHKKESLENPYFYSYTGSEADQQLMTSIIVPIMVGDEFWGVVGVDISLERYYNIITQIRPFEQSSSMLISHDLKYIAHPQKEMLGKSILNDYETIFESNAVLSKIVDGESAFFTDKDINGKPSYFTLSPIFVGESQMPWSLCMIVPRSVIVEQGNRALYISLLVGLIGLLLLSYATFKVLKGNIFKPINAITKVLHKLSLGEVTSDIQIEIKSKDEIGQMGQALSTTILGLEKKIEFANSIGKGILDSSFDLLSTNDYLGKALIDMRQSLKKANEDAEKRRQEDSIRQWTSEGLTHFSELLRQNTNNLEVLAYSIVKQLVQTIDANQGGLFLFNDDDSENPHFFLAASFAFNRRKFINKTILPGEGLIGACAIEKKTVHLKEIPDGYIEITSGLGGAKPNNLLIVPLLLEESVLGVIELASFNEFVEYQIEFVERIAMSIASTITSVRVNIRTSQLLTRTQQQAEEMQAQEEEMRQNMEELQATQEESTRKTSEMQSFIEALNNSSFVIEYDSLGFITSINNAYLELLGLKRDEVIGLHHSDKLEMDASTKREYDQFWNDLRAGIPRKQTNRFVANGASFVFQETYTPIKNEFGEVYKILKIANNITNLVDSKKFN